MTTYAIGDLHGCLTPLQYLLDKLAFDPGRDRLWFVGDIINRGPESLETLRFVRNLGDSAITVLGNHDLHLLAVVHGYRKPSARDTLEEILQAPDRDELCHWLAARPLLHVDTRLDHVLVHAGIHPRWSLKRAGKLNRELQQELTENLPDFLSRMYGNTPARWSKDLGREDRQRFAINAFTRMRYCHPDGSLDFDFNGPPAQAPATLQPWHRIANRKPLDKTIIFGHWSSHPAICRAGVIPTDRGCVWGGDLVAYAIETGSSHWVTGQ
ncbi:symmetrical bis(5'-nucleosyl)-tetraphosphatase [Granulosicoccus sp. 3-233]|uniref:symmetrical bis(5'-nucleosyl)-tetraphosphatase n=1 Tax=Granulosicoccus sp. 3-233 TaxID=3417969 RepID=UPI003D33F893